MKLSLVIPCYNEEKNIEPFIQCCIETFGTNKNIEYIFINDGSKDKTFLEIKKIIKNYKQANIVGISFSRNFGKEAAMLAGLKKSKGEFTAIIDADLQQHPMYVKQMLEYIEEHPEFDCVTCYQEKSQTHVEKPNITAPGDNFFSYVEGGVTKTAAGTSFSTPQVTGTIAQLCQMNTALKVKQSAMGAILLASAAEKMDGDGAGGTGESFEDGVVISGTNQISNKEGAGILDARWARGIVLYGNYWSYSLSSSQIPFTKTLTIDATANSLNRVAIFWLKRNSLTGDHTAPQYSSLVPIADLNLRVKSPSGAILDSSMTSTANFEIIQFIPTTSGTYTLEITGSADSTVHIGIAAW